MDLHSKLLRDNQIYRKRSRSEKSLLFCLHPKPIPSSTSFFSDMLSTVIILESDASIPPPPPQSITYIVFSNNDTYRAKWTGSQQHAVSWGISGSGDHNMGAGELGVIPNNKPPNFHQFDHCSNLSVFLCERRSLNRTRVMNDNVGKYLIPCSDRSPVAMTRLYTYNIYRHIIWASFLKLANSFSLLSRFEFLGIVPPEIETISSLVSAGELHGPTSCIV